MSKIKLPTSLHHGRVVRVASINCVDINVQLNFGVSVLKSVVLESVESKDIPPRLRGAANHCLIILIGGKDVILHTDDDTKRDGFLIGRVYLNDRVFNDPVGMTVPRGLDTPLLEVSAFYKWLGTKEFDVNEIKSVLNGVPAKV